MSGTKMLMNTGKLGLFIFRIHINLCSDFSYSYEIKLSLIRITERTN